MKCDYGTTLTITTLILSVAQSRNQERSFGIKLEHESSEGYEDSCFLDYDEILELLGGIKYLFDVAKEIRDEVRDYTEFEYSTKESMRVGFFQSSPQEQQPFIVVSPGGPMMFVSFEQLREFFGTLKDARSHLIECGAGEGQQVSPQ